jgi:hypothetical protein
MPMNPRLLRPTASGFNPRSISGLNGWWDAADASTVTISTGVSEWRDKSGNARHAAQTIGNNQPGYTNTLNGKNTLTFDGSNDSLLTTSFSLSQPYSVFCVARRVTGGAQSIYHRPGDGPVLATFGGVFYIFAGTALNGPTQDTNWHIFHAEHSGASSIFRMDGDQKASGNAGTQAISQGLRFGADGAGTVQFLNGDIAEILLYNVIASTAQRNVILSYLKKKWGL